MFTTRSSTLFLIATLATFTGLARYHGGVALAGLTMMVWLATQWFTVQWAIRSSSAIVGRVERTIDGESGDRFTLAVGQEYTVKLTGKIRRGRRGFRIAIRDAMPEACEVVNGYSRLKLDKRDEDGFSLVYKLKPQVCGHMKLSGVMVSIMDPNGMFQGQRYLKLSQSLTVLPFLVRPQTTASIMKTNNLQRVLGHHRHKSPGISAELLGIRDYQPGDPPRSIAWKPTARLGRLMSCEYESEVPVRATVFGDLSCYQFVGRPGAAVADRIITATASVTRLLLSDRDPVSIVMASERGAVRLPHGQGERQLTKTMHYLLMAADPNPRLEYVTDRELVHVVFRECYRRFPELFDRRVSFLPQGRTILRPFASKFSRIKSRLAPVLCESLQLPLGHEFRLCHDALQMRKACEDWVRKYPLVTVSVKLPEQFMSQSLRALTNENICTRLMESRARASDNELFVVVGTLPTAWQDAEKLLDVVRVCRAANHRVIYINAGMPRKSLTIEDPVARKLLKAAEEAGSAEVNGFVEQELITMGVKCASINDPKLMEYVAIEVDLIRSGKVRGGFSRRNVSAGGRA